MSNHLMDKEFEDPMDSVDAENEVAEREERDRDNESRVEDEVIMPGDVSRAYDNLKKDINNTFSERDLFEAQLNDRTISLVKEIEDILNEDGYICDKSAEDQMKVTIKKYLIHA